MLLIDAEVINKYGVKFVSRSSKKIRLGITFPKACRFITRKYENVCMFDCKHAYFCKKEKKTLTKQQKTAHTQLDEKAKQRQR